MTLLKQRGPFNRLTLSFTQKGGGPSVYKPAFSKVGREAKHSHRFASTRIFFVLRLAGCYDKDLDPSSY